MGVPQELGTPDRLRLDNDRPWGWPDPNTPGPKPASGLCGATNTGARGGNRLAKATKWDGKDGRESERSIVPRKPGNSCREDPGEGRGRLVAGPWPGNSAGASNLDPLSTRRMPKLGKSGSVGGGGGNPAADPARRRLADLRCARRCGRPKRAKSSFCS